MAKCARTPNSYTTVDLVRLYALHFQLVRFVLAHMGKGQKKDQLEELLISGNFKVSFMKYNWDLNSKH